MVSKREPDWRHWNAVETVTLLEAVALSLGLDPLADLAAVTKSREFAQRLELLTAAVELRESPVKPQRPNFFLRSYDKPASYRVHSDSVRDYFRAKQFTVPKKWTGLQVNSPLAARWPWGDYETKPLRVMAEAVFELWSTFDPDDPETAPKQPDVKKFITERLKEVGYANPDAIASAMATIIRHENAPTGRRRKAGR